MKKWEYLSIYDPTINQLNEFGELGWELVTVVSFNGLKYYLKRELL